MGIILAVIGPGFTGGRIAAAARDAGIAVRLVGRHGADARFATSEAGAVIASASLLVSTVPPDGACDPVLAAHGREIAAAPLRWVGYCSATSVYGDHAGGAVDEASEPAPGHDRAIARLAAENAWRRAVPAGCALDLIRIAGIYGPGRSALEALRAGRARRIVKPGHVACRVHVDDLAALVLAAIRRPPPPGGTRVLHAADDLPAPPADVVAEAARLLGLAPPPAVPFSEAEAEMTRLARSYWNESRRVRTVLTGKATGWAPRYPSFREGLCAILATIRADQLAQHRPE